MTFSVYTEKSRELQLLGDTDIQSTEKVKLIIRIKVKLNDAERIEPIKMTRVPLVLISVTVLHDVTILRGSDRRGKNRKWSEKMFRERCTSGRIRCLCSVTRFEWDLSVRIHVYFDSNFNTIRVNIIIRGRVYSEREQVDTFDSTIRRGTRHSIGDVIMQCASLDIFISPHPQLCWVSIVDLSGELSAH